MVYEKVTIKVKKNHIKRRLVSCWTGGLS